jgi:hypothetical protein
MKGEDNAVWNFAERPQVLLVNALKGHRSGPNSSNLTEVKKRKKRDSAREGTKNGKTILADVVVVVGGGEGMKL